MSARAVLSVCVIASLLNTHIWCSCVFRAVLVYPPSLDYMVAFLACLKAGIIAVPVFPPNPARSGTLTMFSSIVQSSGAKYALTSVTYNHAKKLAGT